ncbi:MAG: DUF1385 domain-containing protein [Eubacterium sp.]|nr:DUF1385 domain-containing protein [Eubacterium sp.]
MKQVRIGGQAVLEGIMMRGPASYSLAVRKSDGEIAVDVTPYRSFGERKKLNKIPIVRGVVNFVESLYIGIKTLMNSSEYFAEDEEGQEEQEENAGSSEKKEKKEEKEDGGKGYLVVTLIISLAFAIGLFVLLPSFLAGLLLKVTEYQWVANLTEGILRLLIFIVYIALISKMEDIKRTFMYHGAEHKTINCLEAGDDLTPENVLKHTRFHKRCGTSFVFIVMIISIIVFMFVRTDVMWLRLVSRILLIPVIAGLSYEVLQYAGRHENACSRILSAPGLWVQRLTTKEPDISMAEVAIRAVEEVIDVQEYLECVRNHSFEK